MPVVRIAHDVDRTWSPWWTGTPEISESQAVGCEYHLPDDAAVLESRAYALEVRLLELTSLGRVPQWPRSSCANSSSSSADQTKERLNENSHAFEQLRAGKGQRRHPFRRRRRWCCAELLLRKTAPAGGHGVDDDSGAEASNRRPAAGRQASSSHRPLRAKAYAVPAPMREGLPHHKPESAGETHAPGGARPKPRAEQLALFDGQHARAVRDDGDASAPQAEQDRARRGSDVDAPSIDDRGPSRSSSESGLDPSDLSRDARSSPADSATGVTPEELYGEPNNAEELHNLVLFLSRTSRAREADELILRTARRCARAPEVP